MKGGREFFHQMPFVIEAYYPQKIYDALCLHSSLDRLKHSHYKWNTSKGINLCWCFVQEFRVHPVRLYMAARWGYAINWLKYKYTNTRSTMTAFRLATCETRARFSDTWASGEHISEKCYQPILSCPSLIIQCILASASYHTTNQTSIHINASIIISSPAHIIGRLTRLSTVSLVYHVMLNCLCFVFCLWCCTAVFLESTSADRLHFHLCAPPALMALITPLKRSPCHLNKDASGDNQKAVRIQTHEMSLACTNKGKLLVVKSRVFSSKASTWLTTANDIVL